MAKLKQKYVLTDAHRAQLKPWADRWIANAMSTKPMDDIDREAMRVAVRGMYEAANLPPPARIVFVPSPLVGNISAGFAAGIWWLKKNNKTRVTTRDATYAATNDATYVATHVATHVATYAATNATYDATDDATREATYAATPGWAIGLSLRLGGSASELLLSCARSADLMRNGGNHRSFWVACLSFFRHVAKLPIDYSQWQHYEAAAEHGSWRWLHPEFCIISDRPKTLKVDHLNRPHCADGPSHEWRDGWKLYHWKGLRIPAPLVEQRHEMTAQRIAAIANAEHRRAAIEIYAATHGPDRFVSDLHARVLAEDVVHGRPRRLYAVGDQNFLHVINGSLERDGTRREFLLGAAPEAVTPHAAVAASYGRPVVKYREAVRT